MLWFCQLWQFFFWLIFIDQVDDTEVISFLLSTEIIPLCLRTMEMGSELSKTVEFTDSILLVFGKRMSSHYLSGKLDLVSVSFIFLWALFSGLFHQHVYLHFFFWWACVYLCDPILLVLIQPIYDLSVMHSHVYYWDSIR